MTIHLSAFFFQHYPSVSYNLNRSLQTVTGKCLRFNIKLHELLTQNTWECIHKL